MQDRTIRVLLVEDNPGDARLLRETLAEAPSPPFQLTHIERLAELEQRLSAERFDIVLLDLSLPDSSRMRTLATIHRQASTVPILVFTGLHDDTLGVWTLLEGAQGYLIKGQADRDLLVRSMLDAMQRHEARTAQAAAVG